MSLLDSVLAEAATATVLPVPPIVYAAIAVVVFVALAFVVWSYRDVANRQNSKAGSRGHGAGHH